MVDTLSASLAVALTALVTVPDSVACWSRYMATQEHAEWIMKIWVPLLIGSISIVCILIEVRVGVQYIGQLMDNPDFLPRPGDCAEAQPGI